MVSKAVIPAVLNEEMRRLLQEIGEIDRVENGKAKCMVCGTTVTLASIRLIVPLKNRVGYVEDRQECLMQFSTMESQVE